MNDSTLVLKATAVQGRNLAPKDKNGFSDPYLVLSLGDYRFQTEAIQKTLNPTWNDTFEMPLSGVSTSTVECVCWDKDMFGKDYMGEFGATLEDIFLNGEVNPEPRWFPLKSSRKKAQISGEIQLQFSLSDSSNEAAPPEEIAAKWQAWQGNFVTTPNPSGDDQDPLSQDLGDELPSEDDDEVGDTESIMAGKKTKKGKKKDKRIKKGGHYELFNGTDVVGVIFLEINSITDLPPERNVTRTGFDMDPFVVVSLGKSTFRTRHIRHSLNPVFDEKMVFQVLRQEQNYSLNFAVVDRDKFSSNDFVAQTNFALKEIIETQPSANPETGLYNLREPLKDENSLSPVSPGLKPGNGSKPRFRLPLPRSTSGTSLSARGNGRVELSRKGSSTSLKSTLDTLPPGEETATSPSGNKIMPVNDITEYDLKQFKLSLPLKNKDRWEDKHNPELFIKAKYVPYPALRQQFWRVMLRQYDADDSGMISRVELTTMLDTLGSTLSAHTIDSYFERFRNQNGYDSLENTELTVDQAVICLEDQLSSSTPKTPSHLTPPLRQLPIPGLKDRDNERDDASQKSLDTSTGSDTPDPRSSSVSLPKIQTQPVLGPAGEEGLLLGDNDLVVEKAEEHVIQLKECPLCHQPRLHKRSEVDIVTHLATCASQDWRQVDKLVMGGFVTSSQAQRKWYSKVISKISYGGYKLGANSANILVQDRITGQIQEERMSVYVRLGIRLLYKGLSSSSMENKKIKKLLCSLSVKQGKKFDNPASARDIKGFIAFHQLDLSEVLLPLDQFKTFNEFFYRALKPGARPCSAPDNPKVIVSPADCRSVVFNKIDDATKIWIKGREFTIARLLGNAYPEDVKRYEKGALGIFRLAPQDYHRFHHPVDGLMGEPKLIKGEYYTVNPMAIRSALDVYGENVRICVPVDSPEFGRVMIICVGAMMVGSTVITAKAGQQVKRTDELGYFQFGGSTIVLLFESGRMVFDDDLVDNSNTALETLIRVGMSIGHCPGTATVSERKENVTKEDMMEARRRIEGSLAPPAN
ncbi:phosphatidylserine decarboxylase-domain-containing protein [Tuber indicum]|nr:phosphatidylserine decarboxylase-domain-containing protein [Tuber indicum]